MKKLINVMLLITMLLCQYSCVDCKDAFEPEAPSVEPENKVEAEVKVIVSTGEVSKLTIYTATVSGTVENLGSEGTDVHIGAVCSRDSIPNLTLNNCSYVRSGKNTNGTFSVTFSNLEESTTYYYRSCIVIGDDVYYGSISSFTTKREISAKTGEVSNITPTTAVISGSVENIVTGETDVKIGVVYGAERYALESESIVFSEKTGNGVFSVELIDLQRGGVTYYYRTCVVIGEEKFYGEIKSFRTMFEIVISQEVDLGLSVKWAGWNVGANSPEEYGGYYAWGETEEKSDYSWDTYKYYNDSIGIGGEISGTQYDVATVKWGNGWRMPSKAELEELERECKWESYVYKGTDGVVVTGPNGYSIFLPCAGCRNGTSLSDAGSYGYYWSGSLYEDYSGGAWRLGVFSNGGRGVSGSSRYGGQSVRPVR